MLVALGVVLAFLVLTCGFSSVVYAQGDIKIVQCPTDLGRIYDSELVSIGLQQIESVAAAGYVKFVTKSSDSVFVSPPEFDTGLMQPNQTETFNFTVTNLGESQDTSTSFVIQVYNHNPIQGDQMTDNITVTMTLLQRPGNTLAVHTIDGDTNAPLSGIQVFVNYDNVSQNGNTTSGTILFGFGGSSPLVTVTVVDLTGAYLTVAQTQQLTTGSNFITLKMYKSAPPNQTPWLPIGVIVAAIVALAVVVYVAARRRARKRVYSTKQ